MEFDETPRFWYPCVDLATWINFAFSPDENLRSDFRRSEKEVKRRKIKNLSQYALFSPTPFDFVVLFFSFLSFIYLFIHYYYYYYIIIIHGSYCFNRVRFCPETIYFFSVYFILNELSLSHFLTSEIFVQIPSLKSLTTYHSENRKIF